MEFLRRREYQQIFFLTGSCDSSDKGVELFEDICTFQSFWKEFSVDFEMRVDPFFDLNDFAVWY